MAKDKEPGHSRRNNNDDPFSEWKEMIKPLQGKNGKGFMSWLGAHLIYHGDKSTLGRPQRQQEETESSSQNPSDVIDITFYKAVKLTPEEVLQRTCGGEKAGRMPFKDMTPAIEIIKFTRIEGSESVTPPK